MKIWGLTLDIFVESVISAIMLKTKPIGRSTIAPFMYQLRFVAVPFDNTNVSIY